MNERRNIAVHVADHLRADAPVEMCEHKGIGHPDTIADGACEAAAQALAAAYRSRFGRVLHFNVDKGLLVGGRSAPRFGGGELVERAKLIVCGRATPLDGRLREITVEAARGWLQTRLRCGSAPFEVAPEVREGSAALQQVFAGEAVRANDTSFGVGYAPLSALERKVLALAEALRSPERLAAAGDDFKVMGLRIGTRFRFTVAVAIVDRFVRSAADYFAAKDAICAALAARLEPGDELALNRLDDAQAQSEEGLYLTVTGLSAEMGDDGQVGRGNRVNGLITPGRPMSLEAAAGKNPCSHVGKIYNVLAHRIAQRICTELPEARRASVQLLSTIGAPIDEPQAAVVELAAGSAELQKRVAALVDEELDRVGDVVAELERGAIPLF